MTAARTTFFAHWLTRAVLVAIGVMMIIGAVLVGPLPGPGFLVLFPIGLALVLKNARWGKKLYARLARRYPHYGRWTNWALRRPRQREMPALPPLRQQLRGWFGNTAATPGETDRDPPRND